MTTYGYTFTDDTEVDALQYDALSSAECAEAECAGIYSDTSGQRTQRSLLLTEKINEGDTLVIWRLDKLADSAAELRKILRALDSKHASLRTLQEHIEHSCDCQQDELSGLVDMMEKVEKLN